MTEPAWEPANDTERLLALALLNGDPRGYFEALADAVLYLPAFTAPGPQQVVTCRIGEHAYLIVFTSPEGMASRLSGVDAFRTTSYQELAEKWPDETWMLAVNPGLPIESYMPIHVVPDGAAGRLLLPPVFDPGTSGGPDGGGPDGGRPDTVDDPYDDFVPANDSELAIVTALRAGDADAVIQAMLICDVYVPTTRPVPAPATLTSTGFPWRMVGAAPATITVFTSPEQLTRGAPECESSLLVPFLDVVLAWPGTPYRLAVNPGSTVELTFPGEHVAGFVGWAEDLVAERTGGWNGGGSVTLQKVLPPDLVDRYLTDGWGRVSGLVTPYDGRPPFRSGDGPVHLIRWSAYCPDLYLPAGSSAVAAQLRVHAVALPHGARLLEVDGDGVETTVATYDADVETWVPAIASGSVLDALIS